MSRRKDSAPEGEIGAGTFNSLYAHNDGSGNRTVKENERFENLLHIGHERVNEVDPGYPAAAAWEHFFPSEARPKDGKEMERQVAEAAHAAGYDGIRYGNYEVQDLRSHRQQLAKALPTPPEREAGR